MQVRKTIKLFIGGKFPRTESGRCYQEKKFGSDQHYAHLCQSSRKDARNAVEAARKASGGWKKATAYLRGQILYRAAEMLEGKRREFEDLFVDVLGLDKKKATEEVDRAIDAFVYYAGFSDKYQQVTGSINPVSSPHMNYTHPEPVGTVFLFSPDKFDFQKLISDLCGIIVSGNTVVGLLGRECSSILAPLAEVFATSDLPGGVVNLLTGHLDELAAVVGSHREVDSISFQHNDFATLKVVSKNGVPNLKRVHGPFDDNLGIAGISKFIEYKTVWHPLGI